MPTMNSAINTGFSGVSAAIKTRRDEANKIEDPMIRAQQLMSLDMLELQTMQNMNDLFVKTISTLAESGAKCGEFVINKI